MIMVVVVVVFNVGVGHIEAAVCDGARTSFGAPRLWAGGVIALLTQRDFLWWRAPKPAPPLS